MEKASKILITGANGFLGHHVVKELRDAGYTNLLTPTHDELNLTDDIALNSYLGGNSPDAIIHLAAVVGGIGANRNNPGAFFHQNMLIGINLIHFSMFCQLEKFVYVSTLCEYPKFTPVPFKEEDIWKGYPEETNAAYAVAKKALRVMLDAYREQYGMKSISLIPSNMVGEYDHFDLEDSHVIPALVRKVQTAIDTKSPFIEVWGDGSPSREFLYAGDCAKAIRLALESDYDGKDGPINVGTGREITIKDLITLICTLMHYTGEIRWAADKPNGQPRRCVDTSRAERILGFKATTTLEEAIQKTVTYWNGIKNA